MSPAIRVAERTGLAQIVRWSPAFEAAGLPHRRIYDLRHTYASFALDAGISIFELSRFMGCGVRVIDRTYGHLIAGSETRAREKLEAPARREQAVTTATRAF